MVEFFTADEFDAFNIDYVSGKYDIGFIGRSEINETPDQVFDFTVDITDFDGDSATSNQFSVTVDGTGTFDSGEHDDGTLVVV